LNSLSAENLSEKQMRDIKGGDFTPITCTCSCYYADQNGSSTNANCSANYSLKPYGGGWSPVGDNGTPCTGGYYS